LLRHAKEHAGDDLDVTWRYLSLEQINNKHGGDWKIWDQPQAYPMRGRLSFMGAESARAQGADAFEKFHLALLTARHVDGKELTDRETIFAAARDAGLDMDRFERDFDAATLDALAEDHEAGVSKHGVFGCPTIVFDNGKAGYLKLRPLPPDDELLSTWEQIKAIIHGRPEISEIKRPTPPRA
jgi:2-hydroxychromene-2-carboxylate isomerase